MNISTTSSGSTRRGNFANTGLSAVIETCLSVVCLVHCPNRVFAINVSFGAVTAGGAVSDINAGHLWNSYGVQSRSFDYFYDPVPAPFVLRSGSLSGHLGPGETSSDFVFGVDVPAWVPARTTIISQVGGVRNYQNGNSDTLAGWRFSVVVLPGPGSIDVSPTSLDFGPVQPRVPQTRSLTIQNHEYTPVLVSVMGGDPPFECGGLGGGVVLAPGDQIDIAVSCNPRSVEFWEKTVTSEVVVVPSGFPSIHIPLSATIGGPRPTNVRKAPGSLLTAMLSYGIRALETDITFESSTGEINDLDGIIVYELLKAEHCTLTSNLKPAMQLGCTTYQTTMVQTPKPWKPGLQTEQFYPSLVWPAGFFELKKRPFVGKATYIWFWDNHTLGDFELPLFANYYTLQQKYVWMAPWHTDGSGCKIVEELLSDTIVRSTRFSPLGAVWMGTVTSAAAHYGASWVIGSFDSSPSTPPGRPRSFILNPGLNIAAATDRTPNFNLGLSWSLAGALLEKAPSLDGPWSALPESITSTSIQVAPSEPSVFFRVQPVGRDGPPVILGQPTNTIAAALSPVDVAVQAGGATPISFQWYFNGSAVIGATNDILHIASATVSNAGLYSVIVANALGSVTNGPFQVTITGP